ncbi:MAG: Sir2 silent information regulator family NAD-dependent deacetylase [Prevotella sp.]|nr:Sir2 silent information regulator family NAD-dependent deacetylase [Prevotella sp.]
MEQAKRLITDADRVLIGAGAGLSAAAGLAYAGEDFEHEFRPWIERYGFTDLYSSSFYPFKTEEERWAYWSKHIWFARFRVEGTALYRALLRLVERKNYFVITTNVDAQFEKSGFNKERIFATQGDYAYLQVRSGRSKKLIYNKKWVEKALDSIENCRIPTHLVPRDSDTNELMSVNLRCDDTFVEDAHWHEQARRYGQFVREAQGKRLLLLEFGVGFNTPSIIRFPFEQMAATFPQTALLRFNRDEPQLMTSGIDNYIPFTEDVMGLISKLIANQ